MLVFENITDVEAWLRLQSDKVAAAFALRAALRALPALESAIGYWVSSPANERGIIQIAFDFISKSWSSVILKEFDDHACNLLHAHSSGLALYKEQAELLFELQTYDITASAYAATACGLATSTVASSGVDAAIFSVKAVEAALSAAMHVQSAFQSNAAEAENMLRACAADATLIDQGKSLEDLLSRRLWITPQPEWTMTSWEILKAYMRSQRIDLERWAIWYEQRLYPSSPRARPGASAEEENDRFDLNPPLSAT